MGCSYTAANHLNRVDILDYNIISSDGELPFTATLKNVHVAVNPSLMGDYGPRVFVGFSPIDFHMKTASIEVAIEILSLN